MRVALTRMVSAGDLVRSEDGYRLSDRLLARQRRQDDAINPRLRPWDGTWTTLVITSVGTDARTRAALRTTLQHSRFGELREGVWLRPDNLDVALPADVPDTGPGAARPRRRPGRTGRAGCGTCRAGPRTGDRAARRDGRGRDVPGRFVAAAAMVRHLLTDPVLPDELLPENWPGAALRRHTRLRRRTGRAARRRTETYGGDMTRIRYASRATAR